jgi:hypothetical protein
VEIQQAPINGVTINRNFSHLIQLNKMSLVRYINGIWIINTDHMLWGITDDETMVGVVPFGLNIYAPDA